LEDWDRTCHERVQALNKYSFQFYWALKALGKKPFFLPEWNRTESPFLFSEMNHDQEIIEEARTQLEGQAPSGEDQNEDKPKEPPKRNGGSKDRKKNPRSFLDDPKLPCNHQVQRVDEDQNPLPEGADLPDDLVLLNTQRSFAIDYKPAELQLTVLDRQTMVSKSMGDKKLDKVVAPPVAKPFDHAMATASMVAYSLDEKLGWGQSVYRIEQRLAEMGGRISRSTLCDWYALSYESLSPILDAIYTDLLIRIHLHLDGTSWRLRDMYNQRIVRFGIYGMLDDRENPLAFFKVMPTEGTPKDLWVAQLLGSFKGEAVADCGHELAALLAMPGVTHIGCNSHGFRKFEDAAQTDSRAQVPLKLYQKIYEVERDFKDRSPDERMEARKTVTSSLFAKLKEWCIKAKENAFGVLLPKSDLATAVNYLLRHFAALTRHLEDGRRDFDNNALESIWHLLGIIRRNALFAGSLEGAERLLGLFSLVISCKLNGISPRAYLSDVLLRVRVHPPDRMIELAPPYWRNLPPLDMNKSFGVIKNEMVPPGTPFHEQLRREARKAFEGRS
jgi:hypothetical protein